MPETQDRNTTRRLQDFVDDPIGAVSNLAHRRFVDFRGDMTAFRQSVQRKCHVNKLITKGACLFGVVFGNKRNNRLQVGDRLRRQNYLVAHPSTSLRASSAGTPSWRLACSRAA